MPAKDSPAPRPAGPRFLVVLDADSTLFQDEVIELLAEHAGSRAAVAAVTERAMRGELDFAASLRERVATLAGLTPADVAEVIARVRVSVGVPELIAGVHAAGGVVGVVSGGFHEVLDHHARALGLDHWRANRLATRADGSLSGEVSGAIVDAEAKAVALGEWATEEGIAPTATVAVGDGANDLRMMEAAALSVAYRAKPAVRRAADVAITEPDLSPVLALLGLRG